MKIKPTSAGDGRWWVSVDFEDGKPPSRFMMSKPTEAEVVDAVTDMFARAQTRPAKKVGLVLETNGRLAVQ